MKIELNKYSKIIHGKTVLKDVSCTFESGKCYGLKGINGSGKTMLMRGICGLIRPSSGEILVDGKPGTALGNVGVLIENPDFIDSMTGKENLKLISKIKGIASDIDISTALNSVGLDAEDKRKYRKYSLGMKQRLGIAAAIMENPPVVILDEPMNALDTDGVKRIKKIISATVDNGNIVIMACHEANDLDESAQIVYEIENGEIRGSYEPA